MFGKSILRVLACAVLVSSLALAGCGELEKLDRQSDRLLDKINDPGHPSSSSRASSPTRSKGSGLSVVRRKDMSVYTVKDARGNTVEIWGQPESTSKTPGHDGTIEGTALAMAYSGDYEYITIQRSWRTATGRVSESGKIPDIIGVRHDGKVDAYEVQSQSDKYEDLRKRLEEGRQTLPEKHRGEIDVIPADPTMKGGLLSK